MDTVAPSTLVTSSGMWSNAILIDYARHHGREGHHQLAVWLAASSFMSVWYEKVSQTCKGIWMKGSLERESRLRTNNQCLSNEDSETSSDTMEACSVVFVIRLGVMSGVSKSEPRSGLPAQRKA